MAVSFNEIQGSPKFSYGPDGWSAVRTGYTSWDDIDTFIAELLPATITTGSSPSQGAPLSFPTNVNLRVATIEIEPEPTKQLGPDTNEDFDTLPTYQRAQWIIRYDTVRGQMPNTEQEALEEGDPVPFLSHRWSIGGEFLTIPNSSLEWADDQSSVEEDVNAGILVPTIEHQITWERVPSPPFDAIRALIGSVNSSRMNFATGTIYNQTLLFAGAELERQVMSDGIRAWKVMYRFSERSVEAEDDLGDSFTYLIPGSGQATKTIGGWNYFWRPTDGTQGWYRLTKSNGDPIYPIANLAPLFGVGST